MPKYKVRAPDDAIAHRVQVPDGAKSYRVRVPGAVALGAVTVTPSEAGSTWTLTGPGYSSGSQTGIQTLPGLPYGEYTATFDDNLLGYVQPAPDVGTLSGPTLDLARTYAARSTFAVNVATEDDGSPAGADFGSWGIESDSHPAQFSAFGDSDTNESPVVPATGDFYTGRAYTLTFGSVPSYSAPAPQAITGAGTYTGDYVTSSAGYLGINLGRIAGAVMPQYHADVIREGDAYRASFQMDGSHFAKWFPTNAALVAEGGTIDSFIACQESSNHVCEWSGAGSFTITLDGLGTVVDSSIHTSPHTVTGIVVSDPVVVLEGNFSVISNPSDDLDVKFYPTNYNTTGSGEAVDLAFNPCYPNVIDQIQRICGDGVLRTVNFNFPPSDETTVDLDGWDPDAFWGVQPFGALLQHTIDITNQVGADIWICLPCAYGDGGALDSAIDDLVALIDDPVTGLAAGRRCWVEYGNEWWLDFGTGVGAYSFKGFNLRLVQEDSYFIDMYSESAIGDVDYTGTGTGDPGSGNIAVPNATTIEISDTDKDSNDISGELDGLVGRAFWIRDGGEYVGYAVTGSSGNGGWHTLTVEEGNRTGGFAFTTKEYSASRDTESEYNKTIRWQAVRGREIHLRMEAQGMTRGTRLRRVMAGQREADTDSRLPDLTANTGIDFYEEVDCYAIAPYIGTHMDNYSPPIDPGDYSRCQTEIYNASHDASIPWIMEDPSTAAVAQTRSNLDFIKTSRGHAFDIPIVGYEGMEHFLIIGGSWSEAQFITLQRQSWWQQAVVDYMEAWRDAGGEQYCYFAGAGPTSQFGPWGIKEHWQESDSINPKYRGYEQFQQDNPKWW